MLRKKECFVRGPGGPEPVCGDRVGAGLLEEL